MPDLLAPRRSAHASIRGYLYQSLLGVERWLRLGTDGEPADAILCEGDEDLDRLIRDGIATSEQVKDYSDPLGIGDRVVRETLARFLVTWVALRCRKGETRRFVFTTTAPRRPPRSGIDVLRHWKAPDRREEVVQGVRDWSRTAAGNDPSQVDEALAWLDEHQAWDEFLGAVEWRFDTPGIDRTRLDVARRLADRGAAPQLHETLSDRLLARVLEASVRPKPSDRILTEPDLTELLALTERELTTWAGTPRAIQLRQTLDEEKLLRPLLTAGHGELPANAPPSKLLTARYEVVPFEEEGRRREIQQLTAWCESTDLASVLLLHGPGGAGKTRLLIEWCRRLRHQGWHAGFLERNAEEAGPGPLFDGTAPRLVVIDYGETRPGLVGAVLHDLARLPETGGPKVRIALLARTAGAWWRQLQRDDRTVEDLALDSPDPIEVTPLVPALGERAQVVARAADAFAAARGQHAPEPVPPSDYAHPRYERALYLHVEALLQVLGEAAEQARPLTRILDHERSAWWSHWKEMTGVRALGESTRAAADYAMAAVTLVQGTGSEAETRGLIEAAAEPVERETVRHLVDLLHRLYPASDGRFISPLEPDLLGEELIREVLTKEPALLGRVLDRGDERQTRNALVVVGRLLLDATLPLGLAEEVLRRVEAEKHLPVSLRDAAATATERVLREHRAANPEPDEAAQSERARLLNNLSVSLGDLGRREDALEAIEQAVDIRRKLADARPDAFLPGLATSLNNLSAGLADLGRREDALEAIEQAVDIRRKLADARPDAFLPGLASSLNNLSVYLADLGRREDALEAIEQAVGIRRKLADARPDAFLPDLATSLNNLSVRLADLGRREDALGAIEQAVDIRRNLADARPDAFLADLAGSLNNLSLHLADLGRREDALDAIEQAVDIRRKLADARPDAFLPDLAGSLNNLSNRLADLGRREDALDAIEQAVDAYRKLADARPDAFLPGLATSLNNLSACLAALDRSEDALDAIEQAVDIRRKLADARPDAFLPDLAGSLGNRSNQLAHLGHHQEARRSIEEAVRIYAPFFLRLPEAFVDWMRKMVRDYLSRCEEAGTAPDAELLEPIEEAFARLEAGHPQTGEPGDAPDRSDS